jgi:hypothetical protein
MKSASNKTCKLCKKRFSRTGDESSVCVIEWGVKKTRVFVHKRCSEAVKNFRISPDEKELMKPLLDDYLEQEKLANVLGISRDELIRLVEQMLLEN